MYSYLIRSPCTCLKSISHRPAMRGLNGWLIICKPWARHFSKLCWKVCPKKRSRGMVGELFVVLDFDDKFIIWAIFNQNLAVAISQSQYYNTDKENHNDSGFTQEESIRGGDPLQPAWENQEANSTAIPAKNTWPLPTWSAVWSCSFFNSQVWVSQ